MQWWVKYWEAVQVWKHDIVTVFHWWWGFNCISGSKVMAILLNGLILHIGGVALGRIWAYSLHSRLVSVCIKSLFLTSSITVIDMSGRMWPAMLKWTPVALPVSLWNTLNYITYAASQVHFHDLHNTYEALQASTIISVSQRWTNFCSTVGKNFWIYFGTKSTLRHTALRISKKKIVVCNHSFSFRQLSVPKNYKILAFLTEVKKVSSTLP